MPEININDLTIGQVKELTAMFNGQSAMDAPGVAIGTGLIGKYAIVRSGNEGVNAGVISEMDDTGIILKCARRIWYHRPANKTLSWYEGVALSGLSDDSTLSAEVPLKAIIEKYSITLCTDEAEKSIREHKAHAQS